MCRVYNKLNVLLFFMCGEIVVGYKSVFCECLEIVDCNGIKMLGL